MLHIHLRVHRCMCWWDQGLQICSLRLDLSELNLQPDKKPLKPSKHLHHQGEECGTRETASQLARQQGAGVKINALADQAKYGKFEIWKAVFHHRANKNVSSSPHIALQD